MRRALLAAAWRTKWKLDKRRLPLTEVHKRLYGHIHVQFFRSMRRLPNLVDCQDYSDKIQWLKLFDQDARVVEATDKIRLKTLVTERVGSEFVPALLQVHERFDDIRFDSLPRSFVIKTNHDSGTVVVVQDKEHFSREEARARIGASLRRTYGWEKGEWAYAQIEPKVFVEEYLGLPGDPILDDYKFHCVDGTVVWCQRLYDRENGPKESLADRDGNPIPDLNFSLKFSPGAPFVRPGPWNTMIAVAEELARDFKYVRVDMYCVRGRVYVGEMTFFPLGGFHRGRGQRILGERLTFDRTSFKRPIASSAPTRMERGRR